ncbi:MarR family transcriptional regulator [Streptomyces sp. AV19]|uniref:MarR family winged helix-turn-helix transcriptional regulator n=1 Tax=Streptomyces sp. AV19 TaxID=2793068 RepID=UPI0018FE7E09|nr:MarR family transcriptional regulator [Streptomyces sp. AV19]MBH1934321.1 MarR family transcriptional regulator [Streptomyces sp. AV19]MDG4533371.1 MarR family transcriptional regulator [Streptomyces sp. AV19]
MANTTSATGDFVPSYPAAQIAAAWRRERPGTPTGSIEIVTPIWWLGKLFANDRNQVLREAGIDAATLDLLSVIRRSGPPYTLSTREIARLSLVTAGAISQRVARAERDGLVRRTPGTTGRRTILVSLTPDGHALIERSVDAVLGREAELVSDLSADERDVLTTLLEKLMADVRRRTAAQDQVKQYESDDASPPCNRT